MDLKSQHGHPLCSIHNHSFTDGNNVFHPCLYFRKTNQLSNKCWKYFSKPEWVQALISIFAPEFFTSIAPLAQAAHIFQMTMTTKEYETWMHSQEPQESTTHVSTHVATYGTN